MSQRFLFRCIHDYLTKKVPCYGHDSRQFYLNCSQEEQQATLEAFKHLTDNGEGKVLYKREILLPTLDLPRVFSICSLVHIRGRLSSSLPAAHLRHYRPGTNLIMKKKTSFSCFVVVLY